MKRFLSVCVLAGALAFAALSVGLVDGPTLNWLVGGFAAAAVWQLTALGLAWRNARIEAVATAVALVLAWLLATRTSWNDAHDVIAALACAMMAALLISLIETRVSIFGRPAHGH